MNKKVGLDFETYSAVDLFKHGLERYVTDSTFQPLIGSIAWLDLQLGQTTIRKKTLDLTTNTTKAIDTLKYWLDGKDICAHNAGFEQRVLKAIGIDLPSDRFIDSAVLARAAGAGGKLEAAAPQLLSTDKLADGKRLILLFSIPGKLQEENECGAFDRRIVDQYPAEWELFEEYCELDASLSLQLVLRTEGLVPPVELRNMAVTMDMNNTGWPVDVATVEEMQRRYLENVEVAVAEFRAAHDAAELNLNSLPQLKEWCAERGVKATSFDEKAVAKMLDRIEKKLASGAVNRGQTQNYGEVLQLLRTKQLLGGSSLKKLQVILDTTGKDCRLRDQYLHIGAGQSYRTTGRSVQMQNLKRLQEPANMGELADLDTEWDNDKLAENIRQCFTSGHPQGQLIVGDFASVESRGLAYLAGEEWKLESYRRGKDMYKVLAAKIYGIVYDDVTKVQRTTGKVGELSCGYGAGGGAVVAFAEGMGVEMTEGEATKLVSDWRAANPLITDLWSLLDEMLGQIIDGGSRISQVVGEGFTLTLYRTATPPSLTKQHNGAVSIGMDVDYPDGSLMLTRFFHGCYRRGRNICYYKPSQLKNGDLWSSHYTDPKTKQVKFYSIYGGKLAGILTQSFCREIFFTSLRDVHYWVERCSNIDLIGQFHDEIVLDWQPGPVSLDAAIHELETLMSDARNIPGFPLEADIKHDYRYTK